MKNHRIVVGVDGSEGGTRALDWAAVEAGGQGCTVHAVTAWQWTQPELGVDIRVEREELARQELAGAVAAARAAHPGLVISTEVVPGPAAPALTRAADGADLLVLGSHGH